MKKTLIMCSLLMALPSLALATGYGVFTQGASGLGQANAVIAHPTGPSSLYFNPALMNDVPGRQVEVGTTAVYADRKIKLDAGGTDDAEENWNFPSTFYYTHQINDQVTAGLGVFFPFGLSTEWDENYAGRYVGTEAEMFSTNINPAVSFRVNDKLSLAVGADVLYLDATLKSKIPQGYLLGNSELIGDVNQKFEGDGWGVGYNLGALYKVNGKISIGASYRSHIDVDLDGDASYSGVYLPEFNPLAPLLQNTGGDSEIRLPQQFTAGVAIKPMDNLVVEIGVRWEDWESTDDLTIEYDNNTPSAVLPRDWNATWSYNIGGQYRLNDMIALNAGYIYSECAIPSSTVEPFIPENVSHLITLGSDLSFGQWTVSVGFGYQHLEGRSKAQNEADLFSNPPYTLYNVPPLEGKFETDIYLVGLSAGYKF